MTSTTPDNQHGQAQSMTSLQTLAELIGEYEDELAACKREFAETMRRERMEAGLSIRNVAQAADYCERYIWCIENGKRTASRDAAARIAVALEKLTAERDKESA